MPNINETAHIITDENFNKLSSVIVSALEYDLYRQAVDEKIKFDKYEDKFSGAGIDLRTAGITFDEYLKVIDDEKRKAENNFVFPILSSFYLTDKQNPCKERIASDCRYEFELNPIPIETKESDLSEAFVVLENGNYILHNATFKFVLYIDSVKEFKSVIRHEITHVYDDLYHHIAKQIENGAKEGEKVKIGYYKTETDRNVDQAYFDCIRILSSIQEDGNVQPEALKMVKSSELMSMALYLLYPPEIRANYSQFYQEICDFPELSYAERPAYKKYSEIYRKIEEGDFIIINVGDSKQKKFISNVFDNNAVYEKIKPIAQRMFKAKRKFDTIEDFKMFILKQIDLVLLRMKNIYKFYISKKRSTEESFKNEYNKYFDDLLENLQEEYGEVNGMYKFTMIKNYSKVPFENVIDKIRKYFKDA